MQLSFLSKHSLSEPTTKLTPTLSPRMPYPASILEFSERKPWGNLPTARYLSFYLDYHAHTLVSVHEQVILFSVGHVSLILAFAPYLVTGGTRSGNENNRKEG